jgi:hypothetical protein
MSLRSSVKSIALTIILLAISIANPDSILACSCQCIEPRTVLQKLAKSDAVFLGKIVNVVDTSNIVDFYNNKSQIDVTFQVSKTWKGSNYRVLTVHNNYTACCGDYRFGRSDINHEYLIYAVNSNNGLSVGSCGGALLLTDVKADLQVLGLGKIPSIDHPNFLTDLRQFLPWIGMGIVLCGIIIVRLKMNR